MAFSRLLLAVCTGLALLEPSAAFSPLASPLLRGAPAGRCSPVSGARVSGPRQVAAPRLAGGLRMGFLDMLKELAMPTEIAYTANTAPPVPQIDRPLSWECGVSEIQDPRHPMEDAWFITQNEIGLFDGVSGAQKSSNPDELYSFQLASYTQRMINSQYQKRKPIDIGNALEFAVGALVDTMALGATTAVVGHIDTSDPGFTTLKAVNVGDSGLRVVRQGEDGKLLIAFKTNPQMHYFNCPFQLGGSSPDSPDQAAKVSVPLAPGDILVMGSDGLYDNVYDNQILDLLEYTRDQTPTEMAQALCGYARQQQEDPSVLVPYGVEAREAGQSFVGGKLDDTCVIVTKFY